MGCATKGSDATRAFIVPLISWRTLKKHKRYGIIAVLIACGPHHCDNTQHHLVSAQMYWFGYMYTQPTTSDATTTERRALDVIVQ
jgi:hypothetical protein